MRRFSHFSILSAAVVLLAAGMPAHAGLFGNNPVPQWGLDAYKVKTPDYAGDASRVILYDEYVETIDAQGRATERERWAFRILKPQGRESGCEVSYDVDEKINYFRAWTIGADEKQYQAKDTDFADVGNAVAPILQLTEKTRVLHPPAADVGAVVICESEEVLAPYRHEEIWHIQGSLPFVYEAMELDLPAGMKYAATWHRFSPIEPAEATPNHVRYELHDVKAQDLRDVKSRLSTQALAGRVALLWGDAAVEGTDGEWRALGKDYTNLEEHRSDPSPEITAKAQELTAGAGDDYTKLKDITEYIQKNVRYFVVERGIGGWQSHYASDIFRNRYGDCKDKTTLLISMLNAVGIKAFYLAVDDRRGVVDPNAPSSYGNHMITAIALPADANDPRLMAVSKGKDGARYLIFDPTNERTPVGNLPEYEQGSYGLLAAGDASQVLAIPVLPPEANGAERKGTFTLGADGSLSGTVVRSSTGPAGADLREMLKYTDEKEQRESLEKSVARDLPGMILISYQFTEPLDLEKPLGLEFKVAAPLFAKQAGPLFLVRPRVMGDDSQAFDEKPRAVPIVLTASGRWRDSFDITLPDGYVVDELPDPVNVDMDFASYHSKAIAQGNVLHYEREYVVRQVEIPASRTGDFQKLEGAILADQREAAVLKKK